MDATTGIAYDPTMIAAATLTLALPKTAFRHPGASQFTGELYLADIGVPPEVYATPGLRIQVRDFFARSEIIRLQPDA